MRRAPARDRRAPKTEPDTEAIDARRARSLEEPLDARLRSARPYPLLEVRNPMHGTVYLVMLPEFPGREGALCTCTDFARRGLGTCKHIEAGLRWLVQHPDAPPLRPEVPGRGRAASTWRRVDQRLAASAKDRTPDSLRWRRAGAVLYETPEV